MKNPFSNKFLKTFDYHYSILMKAFQLTILGTCFVLK